MTSKLGCLRVMILSLVSSLLLWLPLSGRAHEVTPTIADFEVSNGQLALSLQMNVEAFVAGIDLDERSDTDSSARSADYDLLRQMSQSELDPMVRLFVEDWLEEVQVEAGGPVPLKLVMPACRGVRCWS